MNGMNTTRAGTSRGTLFVISAPSGAGKTTLVKGLLARGTGLAFSISFTTRPPRAGEVDGRDYFFVDDAHFARMVEAGEFLEHARVFGHSYGTSRAQVETHLAKGRNVLLEIDWQGAQQVRRNAPDCRSIFIVPPSVAELERRLCGRATDPEDVIRRRLAGALTDLSHWPEFDYLIVNEDLDEALTALEAVIAGRGEAWSSSQGPVRHRLEAMLAGS